MPPMAFVIPDDWSESKPRPYLEYGELTPVWAFTGISGRHNKEITQTAFILSNTLLIEFCNPGQSAKNQIRNCKSSAFGFYIKEFGIASG